MNNFFVFLFLVLFVLPPNANAGDGQSDSIRHDHGLFTHALSLLENKHIKTQAISHIKGHQYNLALIELKELLPDPDVKSDALLESSIYSLIGTAYLRNRRPKRAMEYFNKACALNNQLPDSIKLGQYAFYAPLEGISIAYGKLNKYNEADRIIDSLIAKIEEEYRRYSAVQELNDSDRLQYHYLKNRALCNSAFWKIKMLDSPKARQQLDEVKQFSEKAFNPDSSQQSFHLYHWVETEYYLTTNDLPAAKGHIKVLTDKLTIENDAYCFFKTYFTFAKILYAEGNSRRANDLEARLFQLSDSLDAINYSANTLKAYTQSNVEKAVKSVYKNQTKLKTTILILIVSISSILIFVSIIVFLIYRNRSNLIAKNKLLTDQYQKIEERNKKIAELEMIQESLTIIKDQIPDYYGLLIEKLNQYMLETEAYRDPTISREKLALKMGTNRQYLIEAIKLKTGKTFNEYIYSYRLKYAFDQISNNKTKPISAILHESGFLTRATFYRTFKQVYGVTPSELRDYRKQYPDADLYDTDIRVAVKQGEVKHDDVKHDADNLDSDFPR